MEGVLRIQTLFKSEDQRTIGELSKVYTDNKRLERLLAALFEGVIKPTDIQNKQILLKPNWVRHSIKHDDDLCLHTNNNLLLAVLRIILEMKPRLVTIGDAPIQGCRWDNMLKGLQNEIHEISEKYKIPVLVKDFRRRTYDFSNNESSANIRPLDEYTIFDLGQFSYLEPITNTGKTNFRVTNYDPDRMEVAHKSGVHKYCITKAFFESDVIISIPKIKTHQKTGITGAIKNLVGINGDKDFLPHHRLGGKGRGGDCYPGNSWLRFRSELLLDAANRNQGKRKFWAFQKLASLLWRISFPDMEHNIAAGWYGNDTTWRMVLDLNTIARFGTIDAKISKSPQREIFFINDAIIGGQGDGPLEPEPLPLGILGISNDPFLNDIGMAQLMRLSAKKLKLLQYPDLWKSDGHRVFVNGSETSISELESISIFANPPIGWRKYLNT